MHGCNLAYIDYHERIVRLLTWWVNVKKKINQELILIFYFVV